jgi:hypothetical protein
MIATVRPDNSHLFFKRLQWKHLRVTAEALWFPEVPGYLTYIKFLDFLMAN